MKKLTQRQTKIIVISILFFSVLVLIIVSILLFKSKEQKKYSVSSSNSDSNSQLANAKNQAISKISTILQTKNIAEAKILKKLQDDGKLTAKDVNWKNYLNETKNHKELNNREKNIIDIINDSAITVPNPSVPNPSNTPKPDIPPTNKWEKILWEIEKFLNTNPTKFQEIKDWLKTKNYPDPLAGADLKGAEKSVLKGLPDSGKVVGLEKFPTTEPYKDYVQLSAAGDGNCFLNSFSVFLTGKNGDTSWALPLRVKICLEILTNPNKFLGGDENSQLIDLKEQLIGGRGFAKNGTWLENSDIIHMAWILKRNITVVTYVPASSVAVLGEFGAWNTEQLLTDFTPAYSENWVIYNSGGHFQPLIKK